MIYFELSFLYETWVRIASDFASLLGGLDLIRPVVYGQSEPMRVRFDVHRFAADCEQATRDGVSLLWRAKGSTEGDVMLPWPHRPTMPGIPAVSVDFRVAQQQHVDRAMAAFTSISELGSLFGRVTFRRSNLTAADSEMFSFPSIVWTGRWLGVPRYPVYAALINGDLRRAAGLDRTLDLTASLPSAVFRTQVGHPDREVLSSDPKFDAAADLYMSNLTFSG